MGQPKQKGTHKAGKRKTGLARQKGQNKAAVLKGRGRMATQKGGHKIRPKQKSMNASKYERARKSVFGLE